MRLLITCLILCMSCKSYPQDRREIKYDGSDLQEFITKLPNNAIVIFENAEVISEATIVIDNKKDITFRFNGFTLKANTTGKDAKPRAGKERNWPRNRSHLVISNSENISIEDLVVVGPHVNGGTDEKAYVALLEAQHAVEITNSRHIDLIRANVSMIYGDGVYIGNNSSTIRIFETSVSKNGRQGIAVTDGSDISIEKCNFSEIRRAHIDLECNKPTDIIENVRIESNTFGSKRLKWIAAASSKGIVRDIKVENNTINCPADIYLGNKKNPNVQGPYEFSGNVATKRVGNPQGRIWKLFNVNGFKAYKNTIPAQKNRGMVLVGQYNSKNIEIGENDVSDGTNAAQPF